MLNKTVTVIIGEDHPSSRVTLIWPEYKKIASQYMPDVMKHLEEIDNPVIRTCSSVIVNFIGTCVYYEVFQHDKCKIIVEGKEYGFNEGGYLVDWTFGILDFFEDDEFIRKNGDVRRMV